MALSDDLGKITARLFNKILKSPERSEGDFKIWLNNRAVIFPNHPRVPCDSLLIICYELLLLRRASRIPSPISYLVIKRMMRRHT